MVDGVQLSGVGVSLVPATAASGTVTSVSVTTANGVSGSVATPTSTPAITLTLGAISPTTVAIGGATIGSNALAVTGTANVSGATTAGTFVPTSSAAPTDGMYLNSAGQVAFAAGSTRIFFINSAGLLMNNASGATLTSSAATATAATLIPLRSDSGSGIGSAGAGKLSFISTSIEQLRVNNGSIYVGGATTGADAAAIAPVVSGALSTGSANNPDLVFQTGIKTTSGSAQATATTALTIKGETQAVTIAAGKSLVLGNAATTGLVAGTLAALTNATVVITDSTGQAYRIPCII